MQWFERRLADGYDAQAIGQAFHDSGRTLKESTWSIARIVEAVGYADVVSFARLFAKVVGETPARYRRRHAPAPRIALEIGAPASI